MQRSWKMEQSSASTERKNARLTSSKDASSTPCKTRAHFQLFLVLKRVFRRRLNLQMLFNNVSKNFKLEGIFRDWHNPVWCQSSELIFKIKPPRPQPMFGLSSTSSSHGWSSMGSLSPASKDSKTNFQPSSANGILETRPFHTVRLLSNWSTRRPVLEASFKVFPYKVIRIKY